MPNLSSEDETDTLPKRPTKIQPYQFEPVGQDFERVPGTLCQLQSKPYAVSHGVCEIALTEVLATQMGGAARKSAHLKCINLIHFLLTASRLCGSSCSVIPGVVCEFFHFAATQQAGIVNFFCRPLAYTVY